MRTLTKLGVIGSAAVFLLSGSVALAEGRENSGPKMPRGGDIRREASSTPEIERARLESVASSTQKFMQDRMQAAREQAQSRMTAVRQKEQQHLARIQDKMKQEQAKRLAKQFDDLNKTWTDRFADTLNKYDAIVLRVQDRATAAASSSQDITSTTAALTAARTAIADARRAVLAQAGKVYAISTSTPATTTTATSTPNGQQGQLMKELRTSFNQMHQALFKDLFALRDGPMKAARDAVQAAIRTLGKVPGIDDDRGTATSTASTTHQ
jgi:hypothetical protein